MPKLKPTTTAPADMSEPILIEDLDTGDAMHQGGMAQEAYPQAVLNSSCRSKLCFFYGLSRHQPGEGFGLFCSTQQNQI